MCRRGGGGTRIRLGVWGAARLCCEAPRSAVALGRRSAGAAAPHARPGPGTAMSWICARARSVLIRAGRPYHLPLYAGAGGHAARLQLGHVHAGPWQLQAIGRRACEGDFHEPLMCW